MNVFDAEMKVFNTEVFLQHNITDLNFAKTFQCFAQSGKALMVERHKHTHTHTHTHTHACNYKNTLCTQKTHSETIMLLTMARLTAIFSLEQRIKNLTEILILTEKGVESIKPSAVCNDLLEFDYFIDFCNFDILAPDENEFNHLIK